MKKLINNMLRAALVVFALSLSSCQEEYEEIGGGNEEQFAARHGEAKPLLKQDEEQILDRGSKLLDERR